MCWDNNMFWDIVYWDIVYRDTMYWDNDIFWDIVCWDIMCWDNDMCWDIMCWDTMCWDNDMFWDIVYWDIVGLRYLAVSMDVSTWYAIGVFGAITLCIIVCMFLRLSRAVFRLGKRIFFRYLIYADIPKASGHSYYTTRYKCFLFLSVLTANIAAITIGVDDRRKFVKRTGMVAVINIVPLFLGTQISVVASNFNVKLGSNARLHRWLGTAAIMEGILHAATSLSIKKPKPSKREEIAGFLRKRPLSCATIQPINYTTLSGERIPVCDAVHLHVRLSRGWTHRAGQYMYLCIPRVNRTSFSQLHPFYVAWWYREGEFDYAVFIIKKYTGFTKLLVECNPKDRGTNGHLTALIEGPYGKELKLDLYGTMLLFATGIGIAGQLSYMSQLLRDYRSCETKTRRIALFWQVRSEGDLISLGERISMTYGALDVTDVLNLEISQRKGRITICRKSSIRSSTGDDVDKDAVCVDEKIGIAPETHSERSLIWAKRLSTGLLTAIYRALRSKIAQ
ncbi:uncharacterized protein PgNI_02695 [Pyricularia grisea]|uniref:FAD-binding FR-type domain-containing protein n=1 Tax=Pyricularia grisea TaxID=148305 RepID=A0A6P8BEP9_PYRGI|nr:uncharacterized protein PgNI_02695 [Pyricularia grisea]TLD14366.1 hypothetical protein PgNI_02695 [Pyricularia grisea]